MTVKLNEYDRLAAKASERVAKLLKEEGAQAQALFDRIAKRHGLPTAKILFERCIKLAKEPAPEDEQRQYAAKRADERNVQAARALSRLPTLEEVAAAGRDKISDWYYRWPDRKLRKKEQEIYNALLRRYVELGGYREDFDPKRLTPTKKRGSKMRNSPNAELPRLFEEAKARHGQDLAQAAFAKMHADQTGQTADNVRKKLDYHLKRKT